MLHLTQELEPPANPVRFNMGEVYRERIAAMIWGLKAPASAHEAAEAIRSLIDKVVAYPDDSAKGLSLDLHGDLAQILRPSLRAQGRAGSKTQKTVSDETVSGIVEYLVAGATANSHPGSMESRDKFHTPQPQPVSKVFTHK